MTTRFEGNCHDLVTDQEVVTVCHEAMATEFALTFADVAARYARQAAAEAFRELDRLESRLSAFREDSDLARLARQPQGAAVRVDPDTYACLSLALAVERATRGALNVAYRTRPPCATADAIRLLPGALAVEPRVPGVQLDLGGIGKGFALDRLAALLVEWDITSVLLRASRSTLLACDAPPGQAGWPLRMGPGRGPVEVSLRRAALSGSGSDVQGGHIVDPRNGRSAMHHRLAFAMAGCGAEADALSTAFFVMTDGEIADFCRSHPETAAYVVDAGDEALRALHPIKATRARVTAS